MNSSAKERQLRGQIRGGYIVHRKYPYLARHAGSLGGQKFVENHPEIKTSDWGKKLRSFRGSGRGKGNQDYPTLEEIAAKANLTKQRIWQMEQQFKKQGLELKEIRTRLFNGERPRH